MSESKSSEKVTEAAAAGACGGATVTVPEPKGKPRKSIKPRKLVKIPSDEWEMACEQAKELEEEVPDQKFEQCPYDKGHRVPSDKFVAHFHKCRENYRQMKLAKGEQLLWLACKYNYKHQMPAPELLFHLERCKDRHEVPFYLLQTDAEGGLDESKIPKAELDKMWEGKLVDQFIGSDYATAIPIPLEEFRHPKAAKKKRKEMGLSQTKTAQVTEEKQEPSSGGLEEAERMEEAVAAAQAKVYEDGIDWEQNTGRSWYFTDGDYNPSKPQLSPAYPIGLNREQRREFDKWNKKWMEEILARDREAKAQANDEGELEATDE